MMNTQSLLIAVSLLGFAACSGSGIPQTPVNSMPQNVQGEQRTPGTTVIYWSPTHLNLRWNGKGSPKGKNVTLYYDPSYAPNGPYCCPQTCTPSGGILLDPLGGGSGYETFEAFPSSAGDYTCKITAWVDNKKRTKILGKAVLRIHVTE